MSTKVPQTLKYRGGQLNAAPMLVVENFTNWKKRFMCHLVGIESQFKNILFNGPYVPMTADDQMNSVVNYETTKSTWEDLILYHEGPSDVKESRAMDLKLCYNTFKFKEESDLASLFGKFKYEEYLIDSIYETENKKSLATATPLSTAFFSTSIVQDFQDSLDDEEDTRSSQEYLNDLEEEYQERALLAKSKRFFKKSSIALSSKLSMGKNKGLVAKAYKWDEEGVLSDDNEMVEVKVLMALADDENTAVGKESARNGEWVKILMRKCDIRKPIWYLDSGCSRHMTSVKSYLHKYVEQSGPKVVFGDDSTCITKGYGSIKCNVDEKKGIIFNSNKEFVMIAIRVRDAYVLDMTSIAQQSCFFAKASESLNWLWYKGLAHLNFKIINQLAKQNLVIGLPLFVYSKDRPCPSCEKEKRHRASFETKQTSSFKKGLHLFHIDLFRPVTPRSINHEKYTLVIIDEYLRYHLGILLEKEKPCT
ncbi:retrovirus-related pol polyprotein from transposon TNT 1-94 [Tanacetum coccineum]